MKNHFNLVPILLAAAVTIPGTALRFSHIELSPPMTALMAGIAILGASFLVLWACEVIQMDVSQTLAIALVALIAVLPEYAVDMYFTWMAGKQHTEVYEALKHGTEVGDVYAHFAIANMTGANRLLIGIGWPVIVFVAWTKMRKPIRLEAERATELVFLMLATIWGFVVFFKNSLMWYDAIIFISFFVGYMMIASKRPCEEVCLEGPSEYIGSCQPLPRRFWTWLMFAFAAAVIVVNAEPFSEGLVGTGEVFGISKFLLVQWLAPLASEAPEFTVAILLAMRGSPSMALGALVSSKLNQWSLLVGMIPAAYSLSSGQMALPIPMDHHQMLEILLTAAQSILAIALLSDFRLSFKEALLLIVLFLGQFVLSPWFDSMHASGAVAWDGSHIRIVFTIIYVVFAAYNFIRYPLRLKKLREGFKVAPDSCDLSLGNNDVETDKNGDGKS